MENIPGVQPWGIAEDSTPIPHTEYGDGTGKAKVLQSTPRRRRSVH
jgi:hypothetical protein